MTSEALQKARSFEAQYAPHIPASARPAFHATPAIGWMNDPNGFSVYKGEYHLFYQYHPYSCEWGPMHWGHMKTRDFIHWERLPAALAPDQEEYDVNGCFSGGAVELEDGRQLLMYTGVRQVRAEDGALHEIQTQCVAVGDGVDYEKYDGNPVLAAGDLPEGGSALDFRDPKVWRDTDGSYLAAVGNRTEDTSGAVLLFRSPDGLDWTFERVIDACRNQYGKMWECPDYFLLDGRQVLIVSPQEMMPVGLEFHAGNGTVCLIGDVREDGQFVRREVQAVDYGIDFYAPQTLLTPDGRRVMIGWMQNWNTTGGKPYHCRWFGQMSVPRELSVKNGRLYQLPVRELDNYRGPCVVHHNIPVSGEINLPGVRGRMLDMTVTVRPTGTELYRWFRVRVAKDGENETIIRYRPDQGTVKLDRTRSGLPCDIVHTRSFLVRYSAGAIKLRIVMDRFSVEVFVNDGEQAASAVIYTRQEADAITFECGGAVLMDVEKYDLIFDEEE